MGSWNSKLQISGGSSNNKKDGTNNTNKNSSDTERIMNEIRTKEEEERQKLFLKYGILIPPAFGVTGTPSQKGIGPPISVQHRLLHIMTTPVSYIDYLHETDLSQCVLQDHIQTSGIWISAQPAKHTNIRCSCSTSSTTNNNSNNNNSNNNNNSSITSSLLPRSQLFVERRYVSSSSSSHEDEEETLLSTYKRGRGAVFQLRAEATGSNTSSSNTNNTSEPSLSSAIQLTKELTLFASVNTSGIGWIGSHWDHTFTLPETTTKSHNDDENNNNNKYIHSSQQQRNLYEGLDTMNRNDVNVKLGAWIPIEWNNNTNTRRSNNQLSTLIARNNNNNKKVHGYAAVNMLGATAAIHASMPLINSSNWDTILLSDHNNQIQTRTYVSANLNDEDRPPLQITLEKNGLHNNNTTAHISLTQVFTFDRYQINPVDNRAPKIRNTMAWTARLTSQTVPTTGSVVNDTNNTTTLVNNPNDNNTDESTSSTSTTMSLGMAWQINRSIALKTVICPQNSRLTTAIICKRWKQPRITSSFIKNWYSTGSSISSLTSGWGIGIEFEAGDYSSNPESYYYNYHPNISTSIYSNNNASGGGDDEGYPKTKTTLPTDIENKIYQQRQRR